MKEFWGAEDRNIQNQLQNKIYLIRFGHTEALLLRKKGHETAVFPVLQKLTHMQNYENLLLDTHVHVQRSSGLRKDRRGPDDKCHLKCGKWMKDLATGSLNSDILGCLGKVSKK